MDTPGTIATGPSSRSEQLRAVVDDCWQRMLAGETVDADAIVAGHAELAPELAAELRVLFRIDEARKAAHGEPASGSDCTTDAGATLPPRDVTVRAGRDRPAGAGSEACPPTCGDPLTHTSAGLPTASSTGAEVERPVSDIPGYQIIRELSHGGQGVVYEALQVNTKRKVALKVLLEGRHASSSARRRFLREIELIAQLRHPNVIEIFEAGRTPDGQPYYVMDYVRGEPLHKHIRKHELPLNRVLRLFVQVCDAVQYAHQRGIIHRDLKPSNVLVDADGTPKVLDFGLAKPLYASAGEEALTISEQILGTLPYMAPEQTRGHQDEVDTRTDVYALGVILYELLTGHYPYPVAGRLAEVLQHIASTPPERPRRKWSTTTGVMRRPGGSGAKPRVEKCPIDDDLEVIILKALNKERERRYQSAGELAADVRLYLNGEPIQAKRDSAWYVLKKLARRNLYATGTVGMLGAAFVCLFFIGMYLANARAAEAERRALADQAALVKIQDSNEQLRDQVMPGIRRMKLGWFLLELNAGRRAAAEKMLQEVKSGTPERLAMEFLLKDEISPETLLKDAPPEAQNLAFFVIGERRVREGRMEDALRSYEAALTARGGSEIREAAEARFTELQDRMAGRSGSADAGGDQP